MLGNDHLAAPKSLKENIEAMVRSSKSMANI